MSRSCWYRWKSGSDCITTTATRRSSAPAMRPFMLGTSFRHPSRWADTRGDSRGGRREVKATIAERALKHERAHPEDWVAATSPDILLLHGLDGTVSRLCSRSEPVVHV